MWTVSPIRTAPFRWRSRACIEADKKRNLLTANDQAASAQIGAVGMIHLQGKRFRGTGDQAPKAAMRADSLAFAFTQWGTVTARFAAVGQRADFEAH